MSDGGMLESGSGDENRAAGSELEGKSLSELAMQKMAKGGAVRASDELPDMQFVTSDSNDFKDRDDVVDADHDAGAVDEELDQSLSGMAMKKRKKS